MNKQLLNVNNLENKATMTLKEITDLLDVRHNNAMIKVEKMADEPSFGQLLKTSISYSKGKGATGIIETYVLDKRQSIAVASTLNTALLMRVIDRWHELEDRASSNALSTPDFNNPAIAARAWADQYEARLLAESTKAEIGSRREATAMNTASIAVKKAKKLEIELDQSQQYCTVKRMQMIHHGQKFNWRLLKSTAIEMGIPTKEVFDANYGKVKSYHVDVWQEAYAVGIEGVAA